MENDFKTGMMRPTRKLSLLSKISDKQEKSEKNEQKINGLKIMRFYHILKNFSIGPCIFNKCGN